jgi:hypothetical protein
VYLPHGFESPTGCGCSTEYLPVPEGNGWWSLVPIWDPAQTRARCVGGNPSSRTRRATRDSVTMPLERQPGLPRVVVDRIEGRDTLYEFDLTAVPIPRVACRLRPPPALTTADHTPDSGRVAVHGATVHFRAAPQERGDWLRRIDRWIAYANSIVEE